MYVAKNQIVTILQKGVTCEISCKDITLSFFSVNIIFKYKFEIISRVLSSKQNKANLEVPSWG